MTQLVLNISAKQLDHKTKYVNPIQRNVLNDDNITFSSVKELDFLVKTTIKEVKSNKKRAKKFVKVAIGVITVSASILALVDPTMAATVSTVSSQTPQTIEVPDIMKLAKYLLAIAMAVSIGLAMVVSVVAASLGYFRRTETSFKWIVDIIKSFILMLATPIILLTIAVVAFLLFSGSEWFVSPF